MVNIFDAPLFDRMKTRLGWLEQRQAVLAEGIANADTPGYRPYDLAPLTFADTLEGGTARLQPVISDPQHIGAGAVDATGDAKKVAAKRTYEVAPAGNAVDLEEQMAKVNETLLAHNLTTQLYRKYLSLVRIAVTAKN
ncbi:MAG: hypothetical protein U1E42_07575 [Rhodospirillales bacterium]